MWFWRWLFSRPSSCTFQAFMASLCSASRITSLSLQAVVVIGFSCCQCCAMPTSLSDYLTLTAPLNMVQMNTVWLSMVRPFGVCHAASFQGPEHQYLRRKLRNLGVWPPEISSLLLLCFRNLPASGLSDLSIPTHLFSWRREVEVLISLEGRLWYEHRPPE